MSRFGDDSPARMDADERYELVASARSADIRNRPTGLVALGGVVLLIAAGVFAWSYAGMIRADAARDSQQRRYERTLALAAEYIARKDMDSGGDDALCTAPVDNFLSRMEALARRAQITPPSPPSIQSQPLDDGFRRQIYPYKAVNDESIEHILEWIRLAQDSIPCLQVESLKITPVQRTNTWNAEITFSRTERL